MIASLMMYLRPELVEAYNRYWQLIRSNLHEVGLDSPAVLSQNTEELTVWKHPQLILSQTCGMPYRLWLHDTVNLVGTPNCAVNDCPPGYYRSALLVRADDARTTLDEFQHATFAYNQTSSQSGYAAPFFHLKPRGFWFENRLATGQHLKSARAVAEGRADIASLDAVSWRLASTYEPFTAGLRIIDWTQPTPGLPLITAKQHNPSVIFTAVEQAITQLQDEDKALLGIKGLVRIPKEDYLAVPNPDD